MAKKTKKTAEAPSALDIATVRASATEHESATDLATHTKDGKEIERGGVKYSDLQNHYRRELEKMADNLPKQENLDYKPGVLEGHNLCYMFELVYQDNPLSMYNNVIKYFAKCPNDAHALNYLVYPAFCDWQAGRQFGGYPKLVRNRNILVTPIHVNMYLEIWRTAARCDALYKGNPACPDVFILAKHERTTGKLVMLTKEGIEETKSHHKI